MKIKPLGNKIVIQQDVIPDEIVTKAGIIIPDVGNVKKMNVQTGKVIAVGPGVRNPEGKYIPSVLNEGDWIVYNHHAVFKCDINTENSVDTFFYIQEHDIVAILEKEK